MSVQVKLLGGFGVGPRRRTRGGGGSGAQAGGAAGAAPGAQPRPAAAPRTGDRRLVARAVLGRRRASAAQGGPLRPPRTRTTRTPSCCVRTWWACSRSGRRRGRRPRVHPSRPPGPAAGDRRSQPRRWSGTPDRCCPTTPSSRGPTSPAESRRQQHLDLLRLLGRWDDVLAEEPTDEDAHLALARARAAAGDVRGALVQLERLEQALHGELGAAPGPEAVRLRGSSSKAPRRQGRPAVGPRRGRDGCSALRAADVGERIRTILHDAGDGAWRDVLVAGRRGGEVGGPRPGRCTGSPRGWKVGARGRLVGGGPVAVLAGARGAQRAVSPTPGAAGRAGDDYRAEIEQALTGRSSGGPVRTATRSCSSPPRS